MARILVVEDCPDSRALIERSLADHELRLADSVSAAELALGAARFELVLLDLGLPDGDGFQICQRLQQGRETRDLPVVFLTASSELRDKGAGVPARCGRLRSPFLRKALAHSAPRGDLGS